MLTRCVVTDDVPSLRAAQACLQRVADEANTAAKEITYAVPLPGAQARLQRVGVETDAAAEEVTYALLNLGATALASRVYGTAAALTDFAALTFDRSGAQFTALVQKATYKSDELPDYVTLDYLQLFLLVIAARAQSFLKPGWSKDALSKMREFVDTLEDKDRRVELTIRRMSSTVRYPPGEVESWVQLARECSNRATPTAS
jgi:hypothetical protein